MFFMFAARDEQGKLELGVWKGTPEDAKFRQHLADTYDGKEPEWTRSIEDGLQVALIEGILAMSAHPSLSMLESAIGGLLTLAVKAQKDHRDQK